MIEESVDLVCLSSRQRSFLEQFQEQPEKDDDVPVYIRHDGTYSWVQAVYWPYAQRKLFQEAPEGLFLSGVAVFLLVKQGVIVIPDRRAGGRFQATAQGWAVRNEGGHPEKTAQRELGEEVFAYTVSDILTMKDRTEIVPKGVSPRGSVPSLDVDLPRYVSRGELSFLRVNENRGQRVIEFVYTWNLRNIKEALCVIHDDDLPWGGHMGSNPMVLNTEGTLVGVFSGQQGYLPLGLASHSVLADSWKELVKL